MAIQKINLGTEPLGEGGDTYRSANTKINENFSNSKHAASKLVGTSKGLVPLVEDVASIAGSGSFKGVTSYEDAPMNGDLDNLALGEYVYIAGTWGAVNKIPSGSATYVSHSFGLPKGGQLANPVQLAFSTTNANIYTRRKNRDGVYADWGLIYTSENTTKDSKTNLLLASGSELPENSATSRRVGTGSGNVVEVGAFGLGASNYKTIATTNYFDGNNNDARKNGFGGYFDPNRLIFPYNQQITSIMLSYNQDWATQIAFAPHSTNPAPKYRNYYQGRSWSDWADFYTTGNTKLDTNGAIAPSSPTIDLYSDHIEANADGARMNPEFIRNGVGDYTIKNTTGLRDEGWYIKIPNDMNGNPKVAVAIDTDKDGNLSIKTYKRTFSLETFTFGPDLDEPLDIPEGRWIDLRFNDLPEEELEESEPVEEPVGEEEVEPEVVEEPSEESK